MQRTSPSELIDEAAAMNWDEERRAILHGNRVGSFSPWELAYGETVLTTCQEVMA